MLSEKSYFLLTLFVTLSLLSACIKKEVGCIDPFALNYNPDALKDDASCLYQLPTPSTYQFYRQNKSTVNIASQSTLQLLANDMLLRLSDLANMPAVTDADLLSLYDSSPSLSPITDVNPYTLNISDYSELASGQSVSTAINNSYKADSTIRACLTTIALNYSNNGINEALYTNENNIDCLQHLHCSIIGAALYSNAAALLQNINSYNNTDLANFSLSTSDVGHYSAQEHAWDQAFGYFGASIDFGQYELIDLTTIETRFKDLDGDALIAVDSEFNFNFVGLAA